MSEKYYIIDNNSLFIAVYKGINVPFHNENGQQNGLITALKQNENFEELYPVHRLDKVTSGLILIAKSREVASRMATLFSEGRIEKYYLALASGRPKKKQGLIIGDMVKSRRGMWKLTRERTSPAKTRFYSYPLADKVRLYLFRLYTGKTHQIRVAMKSIGAAILGDTLYNREAALQTPEERTYLHAYALKFSLDGREYFYKEPPREGQRFLEPNAQTLLEELELPVSN